MAANNGFGMQRLTSALWTKLRQVFGKKPKPTVAILDIRSVKTTEQGGQREADAGEKNRRPQAFRCG